MTQRGFTLVELMIATSVFAVLLLVATATVVRFTTNFQRSVTATSTQNIARSIIDTLSQSLQFDGHTFAQLGDVGGAHGFCLGTTNYSYVLNKQMGEDTPHVLVQKPADGLGCTQTQNFSMAGSIQGTEMLAEHMRLAKLRVEQQGTNLFKLSIRVVYGDDDLLCVEGESGALACDSTDDSSASIRALNSEDKLAKLKCKPHKGSEFCAVSNLETTVQSRI